MVYIKINFSSAPYKLFIILSIFISFNKWNIGTEILIIMYNSEKKIF